MSLTNGLGNAKSNDYLQATYLPTNLPRYLHMRYLGMYAFGSKIPLILPIPDIICDSLVKCLAHTPIPL